MTRENIRTIIEKKFSNRSTIINYYLNSANNAGLNFVVLNLSEVQNHSISEPADIDILVDDISYAYFKEILLKDGYKFNYRYTGTDQFILELYYFDINRIVRFHFHIGFKFYNTLFFNIDNVLQHSTRDLNGWVSPKPIVEYNVLLLEYFFRRKNHYIDLIKKHQLYLGSKDQLGFLRNQNNTKFLTLIEGLVESNTKISTITQVTSLIKCFGLKLGIIKTLFSKFNASLPYIHPISSKPRGELVFFMGVDGSGKSSLLKEISFQLKSDGYPNKVFYWGLKITILHKLKKIFNFTRPSNRINTLNPLPVGFTQKLYQSNIFLAQTLDFILTLYYCIEYYFISTFQLRFIREENYLLIDRGYYDRLSDKFPLSNALLFLFLPKPTTVVRLSGDLKIFYKRKMEYTIDDLQILSNRMDEIMKIISLKGIPIIDVDTSDNSIKESALYLKQKFFKQYT